MSNTVYLIEPKSTMEIKEIEFDLVDLFNERNVQHDLALDYGAKYQEMYDLLKANHPVKGKGYYNTRFNIPYWILPFEPCDNIFNISNITVLTEQELQDFGWDVPEDEEDLED